MTWTLQKGVWEKAVFIKCPIRKRTFSKSEEGKAEGKRPTFILRWTLSEQDRLTKDGQILESTVVKHC